MSDPFSAATEALAEEYRRQIASFDDLKRQLEAVEGTAVSPRRELTVTMGNHGVLKELKFLSNAHRKLTAAELSDLVNRTITDARAQADAGIAEILRPMLPAHVDPKVAMRGDFAIGDLLSEEPNPVVAEQIARWQ